MTSQAPELQISRLQATELETPKRRCVLVCQSRSCLRNHSEAVLEAFRETREAAHLEKSVQVSASECLGQCSSGPTVQVLPDRTWYCRVKPEDVPTIVEEHLRHDRPVQRLLHPRFHPQFG